MSKKIAPTLRHAIPRPLSPREVMTGVRRESVRTYNGADAYRELRALLALWRATEEHSHAEIDIGHPIDPGEEPGEAERRACPICRARARLEHVSSRPGRGRAK